MNGTYEVNGYQGQFDIDRIRKLRLYHWCEALHKRRQANKFNTAFMKALYNAKADAHIEQVQTLNDFFPAGDTAERDNEINRKHIS